MTPKSPDLMGITPPDLSKVQGFVCRSSTKARNLSDKRKGRQNHPLLWRVFGKRKSWSPLWTRQLG